MSERAHNPRQTALAPCVLEARGLAVGYDGVALVRDVSLAVRAGQVVTLIGPNGGGKSTILKTVAGLVPALGGEVRLGDKPLGQLSARERAQSMAVMLTERRTLELTTCWDVVSAGRYPHTGWLGVLGEQDRAEVRSAMELVGAWEMRDRDVTHLSDGQLQRVLLARAICQRASVLLLDEPTSHLDIRYQIELLSILRRLLREREVGVLMALHELPLARAVSDWLVCVRDGRVMCEGTPDQVFGSGAIDDLYGLARGTYDPATGAVTLPAGGGTEGEVCDA
ncbi:MAG: ABC transporter ATP-binding protein [Coriobacteriales bacterium]|nr:ABC transporter ATP-binding protein [Coriobacteriales bacterium]